MPAPAQLSEIVVTAERVSGDDYSQIPSVVFERRGDFLAQRIRLTNDTRDKTARAKELHQTVRDMLADAGKRPGIALSYGDEFLIPITPGTPDLPLRDGTARADTSSADLYVKMALGEKDDVQKSINDLNAFIKKARVSGRTEVEPVGDVGLSIVTPEKYRYDIIARIVADAKHLQDAMHGQCKPARRRETLGALVGKPGRYQPVRDHLSQVLGRARLHARRDFLGQEFEQKVGHRAGM